MQQFFNETQINNFKKYHNIGDNPNTNDIYLINKTIKYIKYIKWIPSIKLICIGNSVGFNNSNSQSDIDLFIICENNTIWFTRIIITLIFHILGIRKTKKNHSEKICLSFFITFDGMDFSNIACQNDIYLYLWIIYLKPILDYNNTFDKFINSQNWANFGLYKNFIKKNKKYIKYKKNIKKKNNFSYFFEYVLNGIFKFLFLKRSLKKYEKLGKPYGIIISDNILKFHNNDKRKLFAKNFL